MDGTVRYHALEGGFWAIHGDDGVTYDPVTFPPDHRKDGLRVHAVLDVRRDLWGIHMVGPIVDVVRLDLLPCDAADPCPTPFPPVTILVGDASGGGVPGATLLNVRRPPGEDAEPAFLCGQDGATGKTTCTIRGSVGGRYQADVWAPGMAAGHAIVDVPARSILAGECCPVLYVPQFPQVMLSPAGQRAGQSPAAHGSQVGPVPTPSGRGEPAGR